MRIDQLLSVKFTVLNSFSIFLVLLMHSVVIDDLWYNKILYSAVYSTFTRIAVPIFFIISSILFFKDFIPSKERALQLYKNKISARGRTLLIPYFLTLLIYVSFFYLTQLIPSIRAFYGEKILVDQFGWKDWFYNLFVNPINPALWFIKDLFVTYLFSPLLLLLFSNKVLRFFVIVIAFILWLFNVNLGLYSIEALFFISFGLLIVHYPKLLNIKYKKYTLLLLSIIFALLMVIRIAMQINTNSETLVSLMVGKIMILDGILLVNCLYDSFSLQHIKKWLLAFAKYSFFVFLMHMLVLHIMRNILLYFIPSSLAWLVYIMIVITTLSICVLLYKVLYALSRPFLRVLLGGRC